MTHPRFSIVTIAFNDQDGIRLVGESLLAQSWPDFEWVVVDGGSTDGSVAYLSGIDDPRLKFVSERDTGIYNAMNKGIALARGDYLIFMNSGDCFAGPGELASAAADLAGDDIDILYGDALEVEEGRVLEKHARAASRYWYSMFTHHQAIYYRRTLVADRRYDESFRLAGDWALTADLMREGAVARHVPRPVCRFQRGGASFSANRRLANAEAYRVFRYHARLPLVAAVAIYSVKISINTLRRLTPRLYDRLRMARRTAR